MRKVMTLSVLSVAALMFGMSDTAKADHFHGSYGSSYSPYYGGSSFGGSGYYPGYSSGYYTPGYSIYSPGFSLSIGRGSSWGLGRRIGRGHSHFGRGHGHSHFGGGRSFGGRSRGGHGGHRH